MRGWASKASIVLAGLFAAPPATADSYSWGGASGPVRASVWRAGFNEGAGVGGWDEDHARSFATFARRLGAVVPRDARVSIEERVEASGIRVELRRHGRTPELVPNDLREVDLERIGHLLAAHFRRSRLVEKPPVELYTLQLFASSSAERAQRFADRVNELGVVPRHQFFRETCHPCRIPEAHVLTRSNDGLSRVVIGIFDRRRDAVASLRALRRDFALGGFVRKL